ncbi:MAG TPA: hypothetical protein DCY74_00925 [Clostridiales bacterium]|nr:hypothetical protein [Clostridiales bacterium]HBE12710.1 hypothetical protein [Clostridiales bacterium]HCG36281.1 hypothetical protein [Clostridiales bacterium]
MKAIVYESNTGFTKQYAEMLSAKTGLPLYARTDANNQLAPKTDILYLGWLSAGAVHGYTKAAKRFHICGIIGVGLQDPTEDSVKELRARNHIDQIPVFYLQGGLDCGKLNFLQRRLMNMMRKIVTKSLASKPELTRQELQHLQILEHGGSYVKVENLNPVLRWMETSS